VSLNWNFQRGGGSNQKPSIGGVWIFSGTTHFELPVSKKKIHATNVSKCNESYKPTTKPPTSSNGRLIIHIIKGQNRMQYTN